MWNVLLTDPGRILGQVQIRPEKFNVEPGHVLRLRPGRAASRPGRVLGRAMPPNAKNLGE